MSVHLLTATFESETELPADNMVNTFYFEGSGADPANAADMVHDFFDQEPDTGVGSISEFMTTQALSGTVTYRMYDLSDPEPRAPIYTDERTLANITGGTALPTEVALVFSYHSQFVSGVPAARRRGRIYLGGLVTVANTTGRPALALRQIMVAAGREFIQASNASVSWEWQQYSQRTGEGNIVVGGWVDDAWDTQRRRGIAPSSRLTFTGGTP